MAETDVLYEFSREPGFSCSVFGPECSHMLHKIKPGKMAYVKVRKPFVEKFPGIAIVKLMYKYHIGTMCV